MTHDESKNRIFDLHKAGNKLATRLKRVDSFEDEPRLIVDAKNFCIEAPSFISQIATRKNPLWDIAFELGKPDKMTPKRVLELIKVYDEFVAKYDAGSFPGQVLHAPGEYNFW